MRFIIKDSKILALLCFMRVFQILIILASFFWAGSVLSISFMEAPLKFTAPGINTQLGLGIGRIVFHTLNKIEWILAITILISLGYIIKFKTYYWLFGVILCILIYQTFILLPQLDERAEIVLSGITPTASYHHWLYIIIEAIKLICLLIFGIIFTHKNLK
jgi:hypothetical protein